MSEGEGKDGRKKHRHDVGLPDHGAVATEAMTRAIQAVLLLLILGVGVVTVYAIVLAVR